MFHPISLLRLSLCVLALAYAACPSSALAPGEGPENCSNGIDDNADGKIDCLDPKCIELAVCTFGERCNNGIDDNANQLIDCADPQCEGQGCGSGCLCVGGQRVIFSGDGGPNIRPDGGPGGGTGSGTDGGRIDAGNGGGAGTTDSGTDGGSAGFDAGPACTGCNAGCTCVGTTKIETACSDFADNDGDSLIDCADPDCGGASCGSGCLCAGLSKKEVTCNDGSDNDGDSLIDCADPDCKASGTETCNDGIDNTCDGKVDCADPKCTGAPLCSLLADGLPCGADGQCAGGRCFTESVSGYPNGFCTNSTTCAVSNNAGCNGGRCVTVGGFNICRPGCTGTGLGSTGTCRSGYACIDSDTNPANGNNTCMPFCTSDSECGTAGGSLGCNLWSRRCENKAKGLKSYGEACSADVECEGLLCTRDTPSGYCSGPCRNDARACAPTGEGSFCNVLPSTGDNVSQCLRRCNLYSECRNSDRYGCFRFSAFQNFGSDGGACQCLPAGYGIAGHPEACCSGSETGGVCN